MKYTQFKILNKNIIFKVGFDSEKKQFDSQINNTRGLCG